MTQTSITLDLGVTFTKERVLRDANGSFITTFKRDATQAEVQRFIRANLGPGRYSCRVEEVTIDNDTGCVVD